MRPFYTNRGEHQDLWGIHVATAYVAPADSDTPEILMLPS